MQKAGPLGKNVAAPTAYAPDILTAVPRALARATLPLSAGALPFVGVDIWNAYELSWLDAGGLPQLALATFWVPHDAPHLVESKSLKLYLAGLYAERYASWAALGELLTADLSRLTGAQVTVTLAAIAHGLPRAPTPGDALAADADAHATVDALGTPASAGNNHDAGGQAGGAPRHALLRAQAPKDGARQQLHSALLRSLCPVTGQPDWADVYVTLEGGALCPRSFLAYVLSFRHHTGFHEQCVERMFLDIQAAATPRALSVYARYTRRGGIDINPYRATPRSTLARWPANVRTPRQ